MQIQLKSYSTYSILFGMVLLSLFLATPAANAQENNNTLSITRVEWRAGNDLLIVAGNGAGRRERVTVKDADSGLTLGSVRASRNGSWYFRDRHPDAIPCTILAVGSDGQSADSGYTNTPPEVCMITSPEPPVGNPQEPGTPSDPPVKRPFGTFAGVPQGADHIIRRHPDMPPMSRRRGQRSPFIRSLSVERGCIRGLGP